MLATSIAQAQAMWKLRESVPEAQRHHGAQPQARCVGAGVGHPDADRGRLGAGAAPGPRRRCDQSYGHAGDGNLHFNVGQRPGADIERIHGARQAMLEQAMFDLVESLGGSISAEHGIGRLKAAEFARRADPVELAVMQALKRVRSIRRAS